MPAIERLDHVALHVADLRRSVSWYQTVLGTEQRQLYKDTTGRGNPVVVGSGDASVALIPNDPEQPVPPLRGHIAFKLNRENFDQARSHLRHHEIPAEYVEYETVHSIYFRDPDGYQVELSAWEI